MPPKSTVKRLYAERARIAREGKKKARQDGNVPEGAAVTAAASDETPSISGTFISATPQSTVPSELQGEPGDESDFTYDPELDSCGGAVGALGQFAEDWVLSLDRDNVVSLSLFLMYNLVSLMNFTFTNAAEYVGIMLNKSERTVRQWHSDFREYGCVVDSKQGTYQRTGILWSNEHLNRKVTEYVRQNSNVKGKSNLTKHSLCHWINEELLPNENLEPGFPRQISVETARKWLHELGFEVLSADKGMFFDGHEREDVVKERKIFLEKMIETGFLHPGDAPTPQAASAFPSSVPLAPADVREKTVVIFHDESTFQANEDQSKMWGKKGEHMLRPKSKGSGIMVSDFVDEKIGYLALPDDEFERASATNRALWKEARCLLEYGESREGYWTGEKFMIQMEHACEIADVKYPRDQGWKIMWVFDQSSCHKAMALDALDASKMNVNPGGKQPAMHDTVWAGKPQKMCFNLGIPKGMKQILKERGIDTDRLTAPAMRDILRSHEDFKNEKPKVIQFLESKGHTAIFLPKFHPEINPIERVWAMSKQYTKAYCKYTLPSLRNTIPLGLNSVAVENIRNFHRKCRHYMYAYLEGHTAGGELEGQVKKYKTAVKSHRRIGVNE